MGYCHFSKFFVFENFLQTYKKTGVIKLIERETTNLRKKDEEQQQYNNKNRYKAYKYIYIIYF